MYEKVPYADLNSRQKENYNFHKVASRLADYGFTCLRLSDDWQGADFIACHINGETFLKVQLKGRLGIDKKYQHKDIHVAFIHTGNVYVYDHDQFIDLIRSAHPSILKSKAWLETGRYSWWPNPSTWALEFLKEYRF